MSTVPVPRGGRLILSGVPWKTYQRVLRVFDDRHLRITYDRGELEIMTISPEHERFKHLIGFLIGVLVEELGWNMSGFGSMTFKRRKPRRGLEPDECYWIQNEALVRGKDRIDLRVDPPPDLVVEIDWTHSSLNRLAIFAIMAVLEVWCFDGKTLRVFLLATDGCYAESPCSRAFPFLPLTELQRFLEMRKTQSETDVIRKFRTWVKDRIAAGWK
ncbi:MAG TPA: Uma2 family endonuclease [Gemmataceae bacterium]|nr:Uma2 family endonuclease [Gemmataceae bacterium]